MKLSVRLTSQILLASVLSLVLVGCGGGGGEKSSSPSTGKVLQWTPPQNFADQTPLDPSRDLDHYEIYVNETGNFTSSEQSDAVVSAVNPAGGGPVTSFNIANLAPFLSPNVTYYLSMKSVSVTGVKSDFSTPVPFSI